MHEPVGLINNINKNFRNGKTEETHVYHAIREKLRHQLRHPGRELDLKRKDLICKFFWSLTNENAWFVSSFCSELTVFCTVFEKNCSALNQSKWRNFVMYIINADKNREHKHNQHNYAFAFVLLFFTVV